MKAGYISDYISGQQVKDSPEERDAVQVFSHRLVEDYGYPKEHIQTRPQYRVRCRPSDEDKSYPVDIAVFRDPMKIEDGLQIIVECKQKTRKDGIHQLKLYLDMSPAEIGVWFNGDEHEYLRKVHHKNGKRTYEALPTIPRYGQRIEDIGLYKRQDLRKPSNLKAVFRDLRNHLAGMTTGITRDEALAQEIINLLFCKILDEQETEPDQMVTFRAGVDEKPSDVLKRINSLFERVKNEFYEDVFDKSDRLKLDDNSLFYVVGELQNYCVMDADRDAIGDAFEVFIGPALRGAEGQFFTPRNVVKMMIEIIDPKPGEKILDPACGSGGFLICALEHVWQQVDAKAKRMGWSAEKRYKEKVRAAMECFRGSDKDAFLARVCKAYMALVGDGRGGVFCANSLQPVEEWPAIMQEKSRLGSFDVVLTNPPFGKNIVVKGEPMLAQYNLGHRWKLNKADNEWQQQAELHEDQPPQILFIDRCLQFLKPGGRMAVVLPESVFGMPTYAYVVAYLQKVTKILGVISMPEPLFKTSGKGGTHAKVCVLFLQKGAPNSDEDWNVFMAEAKWCGHDSRGNPTIRTDASGDDVLLDDVPKIAARYHSLANGGTDQDLLGFYTRHKELISDTYIAKYYDPALKSTIARLSATYEMISLGDLVAQGVLSWETGIEVGKMAYGTGEIPFIRTSDISNWELKGDPKQGISDAIFQDNQQDVKEGDIFVVRDGTYLVGTSCIITSHDTQVLFCGGIYKLRSEKPEVLDPYLLLTLLNTPLVRAQMKSKQFTRDIIDTLGKRLFEVVIPIPKDKKTAKKLADETRELITTRVALRERTKTIAIEAQGGPIDMAILEL